MPFIGRDWRSPGDQWVRTTEGWEKARLWRVKIFGNLNHNVVARIIRLALLDYDQSHNLTMRRQPYILFNSGTTREKSELTSLSEALIRLDVTEAAKDLTRANYVSSLIKLILETKLPNLSGTSQKLVLNILESMVEEAMSSELNIGVVKDLLVCAKDVLQDGKHRHIGSECLWDKHIETVDKLTNKLLLYQMKERTTDGKAMLTDLPEECLRDIFSRISDHKDLIRIGQTNTSINEVAEASSLWREMCLFHFTDSQVATFIPKNNKNFELTDIDWKYIYRRCYKRFGKKEVFADMLAICSNCVSIHWQDMGHPCVSEKDYQARPLSPEDFLSLFKL